MRVVLTDAGGGLVQADAARSQRQRGALLGALTASLVYSAITDENGILIVAVLDTAKTLYYPCASIGAGPVSVGAQLVSGSYGA